MLQQRRRWPLGTRVALGVLAVLALTVVGGDLALRDVAPDTVVVHVYQVGSNSTSIYSAVIHNPEKALATRQSIDEIHGAAGVVNCPTTSNEYPVYSYDFEFLRHGIVIETVHEMDQGCDVWTISKGGLPAGKRILAPPQVWQQIAQATGAPLPPGPNR